MSGFFVAIMADESVALYGSLGLDSLSMDSHCVVLSRLPYPTLWRL